MSVLALYWATKFGLRRRALRLSPVPPLALIPSALIPWGFFGCARNDSGVRTFKINAFTGEVSNDETVPIFDEEWAAKLEPIAEFREMKKLTPAYHVVEAHPVDNGGNLVCRDLRTRNFNTRFGTLTLRLDLSGNPQDLTFHV